MRAWMIVAGLASASICLAAGQSAAGAKVALAGVSDGGIKLTTDISQVSFSYPFEAQGDVMGLTLSFDEFHGPANSIVTATVTLDGKPANQPIKIKKSDRPVLRVLRDISVCRRLQQQHRHSTERETAAFYTCGCHAAMECDCGTNTDGGYSHCYEVSERRAERSYTIYDRESAGKRLMVSAHHAAISSHRVSEALPMRIAVTPLIALSTAFRSSVKGKTTRDVDPKTMTEPRSPLRTSASAAWADSDSFFSLGMMLPLRSNTKIYVQRFFALREI
jgi:hypothetical protein